MRIYSTLSKWCYMVWQTHDTHQLGMRHDNLHDALAGECLFSETFLDVVKDFSMSRVGFVEDAEEGEVCRAETVAKVLGENPTSI